MSKIAGRTILITGGGSGIGRCMARRMRRLGGRIVIWDVNRSSLEAIVTELNASGPVECRGYSCDVSCRQSVYDAAARVRQEVGPVDILVNNAGVVSGKPFRELEDEQIQRTVDINTMSLFWTAKAFLPQMIENGRGHIVTVASAAGTIGVAGLADYCASKWAAVGFDESLRVEMRRWAPGVKTTIVCPYFIDTGMFRGVKSRYSLLLPILDQDYVARRIVQAIRRNKPRLMMPRIVYLVPVLRFLPPRLFDAIAGLLGINVAMDSFEGRTGGHP